MNIRAITNPLAAAASAVALAVTALPMLTGNAFAQEVTEWTTYKAGLMQGRIGSAKAWTTAVAEGERALGCLAFEVPQPKNMVTNFVNALSGNEFSIGSNYTFAYVGEMFFEKDVRYIFGKSYDTYGFVNVDGTQIIKNELWNGMPVATQVFAKTGWYPVDFRVSGPANSTGARGPYNWNLGIGFNTNDVGSVVTDDEDAWQKLADDGTMSLLRTEVDETYVESALIAKNGDQFQFTVTLKEGLGEAAVLTVYSDAEDQGAADVGWAGSKTVECAAGQTQISVSIPAAVGYARLALKTAEAETWASPYVLMTPPEVAGKLCRPSLDKNVVKFSVVSFGEYAASATAKFEVSTTADFSEGVISEELAITEIGDYSLTIDELVAGTAYYKRFTVVNDLGVSIEPSLFDCIWTYNASAGVISNSVWRFLAKVSDNTARKLLWWTYQAGYGELDLGSDSVILDVSGNQWTIIRINGKNILSSCKGLLTGAVLPATLESLSNEGAWGQVFDNCDVMEYVSLHSTSLTYIGTWFFSRCNKLTTIDFDIPNVVTIDQNAFMGNSVLTVDIDKIIPAGIMSIGSATYGGGTFSDCPKLYGNLEYLTNLQFIAASSFKGCTSLSGGLTFLTNTTYIGGSAFYNCAGFTGPLVLTNFTTLGGSAFYGCKGITSAKLTTDRYALVNGSLFYDCDGLNTVELEMSTLTNIASKAFYSCGALESFSVDCTNAVNIVSDAFANTPIKTAYFTGPAPLNGTAANLVCGVATGAGGVYNATIYASRRQPGWQEVASTLTADERPLAPSRCFGVLEYAGARKAWLVHKSSPFDSQSLVIVVR